MTSSRQRTCHDVPASAHDLRGADSRSGQARARRCTAAPLLLPDSPSVERHRPRARAHPCRVRSSGRACPAEALPRAEQAPAPRPSSLGPAALLERALVLLANCATSLKLALHEKWNGGSPNSAGFVTHVKMAWLLSKPPSTAPMPLTPGHAGFPCLSILDKCLAGHGHRNEPDHGPVQRARRFSFSDA